MKKKGFFDEAARVVAGFESNFFENLQQKEMRKLKSGFSWKVSGSNHGSLILPISDGFFGYQYRSERYETLKLKMLRIPRNRNVWNPEIRDLTENIN